jgi:hypothetical protein
MVRTELVNAEDQDGLVDLESQDLGLDKGKRLSVDLDETLTGLDYIVSTLFECALDRGSGRVPCSGRQLLVMLLAPCSQDLAVLTVVVPVAVFFLPKHCTLWEAMLGDCGYASVREVGVDLRLSRRQ